MIEKFDRIGLEFGAKPAKFLVPAGAGERLRTAISNGDRTWEVKLPNSDKLIILNLRAIPLITIEKDVEP